MIKSIRTKLFLFVFAIMILYSIIGILLNLFFLKPYYMQQNELYFSKITSEIRELNEENILDNIQDIGHNTGVFIAITDKKFNIIYSSNNTTYKSLPQDVISSILKYGKDYKKVYISTEDSNITPSKLIYMEWLNSSNRIIITKSISVIEESIEITNKFYLLSGFLALTLGSIAIFIFSKTITNPIIKMSKIATDMSLLNFNQHISLKSKDELGSLAESINTLSENLKISMERLEKDILFQKTLSRNLSHQLKTPIAIIKGHIEGLIYSVADTPDEKNRYLNIIVNECDRLDSIIKEMLTLSRLYIYDEKSLNFEIFDFDIICNEIKSRFSSIFKSNNIKFEIQKPENIYIKGKPDLIYHAISNYISNAIKYGNGEIKFIINKDNKNIIISVFNSGKNIPKNELENIFEPFYKLNYARRNNESSHGLGLAIVQSIAKIHKGKAYAENCDKGIIFKIEIPSP